MKHRHGFWIALLVLLLVAAVELAAQSQSSTIVLSVEGMT
jgi:hypothetical protein